MDRPPFTPQEIRAEPAAILNAMVAVVEEAGRIALPGFRLGGPTTARVWHKGGGSPVTESDVAVDTFLNERLGALCPAAGWLSEETADDAARLALPLVWIVDPIDGTRAYASGHPDWSVAVALLVEGRPVAGIVHAPAHRATYAAAEGHGATLNGRPIRVSDRDTLRGAKAAGPAEAVAALARAGHGVVRLPRVPSLALRLVRVGEGAIEAALVSGNARDWDLAAADLILTEAGGTVTNLAGEIPLYNRPMPVHGALVASGMNLHGPLIAAARDALEG